MCKPHDTGLNGFDLDLIRDFTLKLDDGAIKCDCHPKHPHNLSNLRVILLADPAASEKKTACESAICVAGLAPCGCRFVLEEWGDRVAPDKFVDKFAEICRRWTPWLRQAGIETVSFQLALKSWLEQMQNDGDVPTSVTLIDLKPAGREKDTRIKSQIAPVSNGLWHKRPDMRQKEGSLLDQIYKWPYGKYRDRIDALFGYCDDVWFSNDAPASLPSDESGLNMNDAREILDMHEMAGSGV